MWNLPNILAIFRVLLAPLFFYLILLAGNADSSGMVGAVHVSWINYFAALTFVIASVTDFFDGFIARSWNQITKFGGIIDPLADKMLTLAGFLGLMYIDRASPWAVYLILIREFFITGFRTVMVSENISVSASMAGKVKTVSQMFAIGFLTMQWSGGNFLLWLAVALTLYSGLEYILAYAKNHKKNAKATE
ncbi:CDP-diacylglycerol--glycerol-3-phosphate 3-phosphatidyltransferase [Campylobacter sp. JMF_01 NE2]|uniref:CDP-diacylglycerol--glycerol-3-phosphate 3-phosphatidyltransferase n=1 Tax=unclassified Campylobacter TaxID=2593542 RepID=UPI0022E99B7E|nr:MULTISPECIES: CDP-diacylglycerol--glycerol-3-phosphate 3-phosphatidyltransferase [unclassified Campylobacter]MDA3047235.1 CDP-diacylglycerol--glycerol-3-phosphate 3-phosphatidyltransferase [Campylobacter sp. JMF_08 NE1]MDA3049374.1 CDP-diacylglycerol--glycerol-3-phosphate 3-phosphatidyltransferase [Campylobacter sp. JMF_15 NE4]MDA3051198.1 CDP-diacylglycerol--glycerol-3-phosphate 3-phosphatidyltransferase [Campylobacter sp. JMF_02 ED1]MDA3053161.1 CDP-diacylglycerol--glycerol-3-phosphate 3-p